MTLQALATALLLGASPFTGGGDVRIEGDVTYQVGTGKLLVEGGAVIRRGGIVLRARSATFDPATGEVRASGGVLLTDATRAVAADAVVAVLGGDFEAERVVAFVKDRPVDLAAAASAEEARRAGPNRLTFTGTRLRGEAGGRFRLEGARLTLCDCPGGGAPSWEVTAREADVVPGRRAILRGAVLRITPRFLLVDRPVPVLALPWLYLPLGDRQTGLLLPEAASSESSLLTITQPLFVTLGRSADATLAPEWSFGRNGTESARGPGARLELRWAPAEGAEGRLEAAWLRDLDDEPGGEGGHRFAIEGFHAQRLSPRTALRTAFRLPGDPVWIRDRAGGTLAASAPHVRSDLLVTHRRDPLVLEVESAWLQPLRPEGIVPGEAYGTFGSGLAAGSRLPGVHALLLPVAAGPLRLSGSAGAVRFAPPSGTVDSAGRPAATRADARLEVSLPVLLGGALSVAPFARGAAAAYSFEGAGETASAFGVAGASASAELSRRWGRVRHTIAPRIEWRLGSRPAGDPLAGIAYDPFDLALAGVLSAAPPEGFQQLRAAVESRLLAGGTEVARIEVGQDLDLRRGRAGETFASAGLTLGPLEASGAARLLAFDGRADPGEPAPRISSGLDRFTSLTAAVRLGSARGGSLHASFTAVGPGGTGLLVAGLDPLFDLRPVSAAESAEGTLGVRLAAGGATLGYDARFPGRATFVPSCVDAAGERRVEGWQVQEHRASIAWDSPCRCFRLAAAIRVDDCGKVSPALSVSLSRLGEGGLLR